MSLPAEVLIRSSLFAAILCAAAGTSAAQQPAVVSASAQNRQSGGVRLYAVASIRIFNNVNRSDANAALRVWFDVLSQRSKLFWETRIDIVDSTAEIRDRLLSHSTDLLMLDIGDYLELESSHLMAPVMTDARSSQTAASFSYLLLVNPSAAPTTVAGLRGKHILVYSRGAGKIGMKWLEVLLAREKLGRAAAFFGSVKEIEKPQACILPLFFGSADACVVDEVNLSLAKEMNPQLGRLNTIARSLPLIESILATPADPHPHEKELIESVLSLHQDPRGRQLLMVFKTDRIVRIQPGDLDAPRALWRDYNRLTGSAPMSLAGSEGSPLRGGR